MKTLYKMSRKYYTHKVVLAGLIFFTSCFDYYESLELRKDFSGSVQISYTVPVSREGQNSLLAFLPTSPQEIKKPYEEFFEHNIARLSDLTIIYEKATAARKKMKVSYRLHFKSPRVLEHTPLKNIKIFRRANYFRIERTFPALRQTEQNKSLFLQRFYKYLIQKFQNHNIFYKTHYPAGFNLSSKLGKIDKEGEHRYVFPLATTLRSLKDIVWVLTLKK